MCVRLCVCMRAHRLVCIDASVYSRRFLKPVSQGSIGQDIYCVFSAANAFSSVFQHCFAMLVCKYYLHKGRN